jgi:hypothetical protein
MDHVTFAATVSRDLSSLLRSKATPVVNTHGSKLVPDNDNV